MKKVGLVGCGSIAHVHAGILKSLDGVYLVGFADCQKQRAHEFVQQYGEKDARAYASLEEMLEQEELDVVHICTPHYLHVPMAISVLQKQIHVFMEKPPAITREQFQELWNAEQESKATVGVCFQNRYNRTTQDVDGLLRSGELGEIKGARAFVTWNRPEAYYVDSEWRGRKATEGGGALINQAVHTLDLLVRYLGQPKWVEASVHNHHLKQLIEVEDTVEAYIGFSSATACFYATTAYAADPSALVELECERGQVRMEGNQVTCKYKDGKTISINYDERNGLGKSYWGDGHGRCIQDYYDSLEQGNPVRNDLESVLDTFELMMDIYQSAEERKEIECKWSK